MATNLPIFDADETSEIESPKTEASSTVTSDYEYFADNFGLICTILSCGIAGYQILQHLRYYT